MKKIIFLLILVLISLNCYSQIRYEKGYFIDNTGKQTNCLIKNIDWKSNPTGFQYKMNKDDSAKKGLLNNIAEFSISNGSSYTRFTIKLDISSSQLKYLSKTKAPEFIEETVFLKNLVYGGNADLYSYKKNNLNLFFFRTNNSEIQQLIYKKYYTTDNTISENKKYKQQLWANLQCESISLKDVRYTDYAENELVKYFNSYNSCINSDFLVSDSSNSNKNLFNLSIRGGLNSASLDLNNTLTSLIDTNFGNRLSYRIGIEAEYTLPFNKNKWSVFVQPTYQSYTSDSQLSNQDVSVEYKSIEVSLGIRHYFFFSKKSKLFLNSAFIIDNPINSIIDFQTSNDFIIESRNGLNFGIGYKAFDKYSLELNYGPKRGLLGNSAFNEAGYTVFSIILGYTIL